ncbi:3-hydroxy-5-phosphonooxypentane-2,4-dione thiolase [Novipirellula artificiosorum]|uniref:Putative aldolase LsrF n=1 Tax=Novipirellula artificiosorum TaxID=2528016 RepID=A0A5C6DTR1_9BACT|nr:3-hydroxy-5-phosphonooxypentane-2,4-dione thiolase [Novipirellula artificiosorum]TWU39715.1 putative aldolase LsrF [Novipirellula artificiosorum]
MPEATGNLEADDYGIGVPVKKDSFFLKGLDHVDWGIKDRMGRIFNPRSGHTVMLAFDHGYIMGPTSGLERIDLGILPLVEYADCLMCSRGVLRSCIPPQVNKPISLRFSAGTTVLNELNDECILGIDDAIRMNASALAIMVSIGGQYEAKTIENLVRTADMGNRYGIPTLGVTAVGKELVRDARYLGMATRVCAENGATFVKTYYCEKDFEKVTSACPVPIVIAGGKKLEEHDALKLAYCAINEGAAGVDMGRNVFQSENPISMIKAVRGVVHDGLTPDQAFELYRDLS